MIEIEKTAMAHRYLYYVKHTPIISDHEYDLLEKEALKLVTSDSPLRLTGSDLEMSYNEEVKILAESLLNCA